MIGDFLHNLRSALDHIAFALAGTKAGDKTMFPVAHDRTWFESKAVPNKLDGVPARAVTLIRSLQPYHRGEPSRYFHPLWVLNRLNSIDKHQRHHLLGAAMFDPRVDRLEIKGGGVARDFIEVAASGPMEDDTLFIKAGIRFLRPSLTEGEEIETYCYLGGPPSTVAFDQAPPGMGRPVLAVLDELLEYVRDGLVPRFERFFK
jgi:hypothetical protein